MSRLLDPLYSAALEPFSHLHVLHNNRSFFSIATEPAEIHPGLLEHSLVDKQHLQHQLLLFGPSNPIPQVYTSPHHFVKPVDLPTAPAKSQHHHLAPFSSTLRPDPTSNTCNQSTEHHHHQNCSTKQPECKQNPARSPTSPPPALLSQPTPSPPPPKPTSTTPAPASSPANQRTSSATASALAAPASSSHPTSNPSQSSAPAAPIPTRSRHCARRRG